MLRSDVVVTGLGPVSAIGCGRSAFWEALRAGRHGFGPITICSTEGLPSTIGAEVTGFDLADFLPREGPLARAMPRPVEMALAAGALALQDAGLRLDEASRDRVGVLLGTSLGNLATAFEGRDRWKSGQGAPEHIAFYAFNHSAACIVSAALDLRGPLHTQTSGCNSGMDALGHALTLVRAGEAEAMLVIGSDCELVPEIIAAMCLSGSLATRYNDRPAIASRPFDRDRDGNVIGEGAGALLVESAESAARRGARVYARLAGYRSAAAGAQRRYSHDRPELDTRPCRRAIAGAIEAAGWQPEQVGLVSANGSSSLRYDVLEARALGEVFGEALPEVPVHSTKSMLGQHGAGSSALQSIAACLSVAEGQVPPTINHDALDPECGPLQVVTRLQPLASRRVVAHAIGMGGFYYSAAAFEAFDEARDA